MYVTDICNAPMVTSQKCVFTMSIYNEIITQLAEVEVASIDSLRVCYLLGRWLSMDHSGDANLVMYLFSILCVSDVGPLISELRSLCVQLG